MPTAFGAVVSVPVLYAFVPPATNEFGGAGGNGKLNGGAYNGCSGALNDGGYGASDGIAGDGAYDGCGATAAGGAYDCSGGDHDGASGVVNAGELCARFDWFLIR